MKRKFLYLALITAFLTACSTADRKNILENQQIVVPDVIESPILFTEEKEISTEENIEPINIVNTDVQKESKALAQFVNSKVLEHGNIGFYAVELRSGKAIDGYREDAALVPASVLKIVTAATALEVLGANSVLETKVLYDGTISKEGVLKGNIYIQGGGDPTLGSDGISIDREA
ncbi:MAG: D-alanyl-D-alanine carboxypeptidase, partial [Cetobacterium sp.]